MSLDPVLLNTLAAVVAEESFEDAAVALRISPSAVSQRIKALEGQVGQVLVVRRKPCVPTEAGRVLIKLGQQTRLLEADAWAAVRGPGVDGDEGSLTVPLVVNGDSMSSWFMPALAQVQHSMSVVFDLQSEDQDHSANLLRVGVVMAAVTSDPEAVQGCRVVPLGAMRYLPMASPAFVERHLEGDALARRIAVAPLVDFNRKDALQRSYLRRVTRKDCTPPVHHVPSTWAYGEAVRLGLGWGMIPELLAGDDEESGRLVRIGTGHVDVPLYWQHWRLESAVLTALTEAVDRAAAGALRRPRRGGSMVSTAPRGPVVGPTTGCQ